MSSNIYSKPLQFPPFDSSWELAMAEGCVSEGFDESWGSCEFAAMDQVRQDDLGAASSLPDDFGMEAVCGGDLEIYTPVTPASYEVSLAEREEMAQRQDRLDLPPLSQLIGTRISLQPGGVTLQDLNPVFPDAHAQPDHFQQPDYQFSAWRPDCFPAPHPSGSSRPQLDNNPWEQQRFLTAQPGPSLEASALNIHDFDLSHLSCFNNESYLPELRTNLDAARPGPISQAARTDRLSLSEDLDAEPSLLQDLSFSESMEASNRGVPLDAPGASGPCSTEPSAQTSRGTTRSSAPRSVPERPAPTRRRGRPRLYDTSLPEGQDQQIDQQDLQLSLETHKKKRGAKPKYKFRTEAEAVANRRERNRKTAIESYYKRKHKDNDLQDEIQLLQREKEALLELDQMLQIADLDKGLLKRLLTETNSGVHTLAQLKHQKL